MIFSVLIALMESLSLYTIFNHPPFSLDDTLKVDARAESLQGERFDAGLQPFPDPLLSLGLLTRMEV